MNIQKLSETRNSGYLTTKRSSRWMKSQDNNMKMNRKDSEQKWPRKNIKEASSCRSVSEIGTNEENSRRRCTRSEQPSWQRSIIAGRFKVKKTTTPRLSSSGERISERLIIENQFKIEFIKSSHFCKAYIAPFTLALTSLILSLPTTFFFFG